MECRMEISGQLAAVSLTEVFQFLNRDRKTGMLTIQGKAAGKSEQQYYIWLSHGRIVAAADQLTHTGLLLMLVQRKWLSPSVIARVNQLHKLEVPLGSHLRRKGILQPEHLKLLFHAQVLQRVCSLFRLQGQFRFSTQVMSPNAEMTGLSLSLSEATLIGLRVLRDWTNLQSKLPPASVALSKPQGKRVLLLDSIEGQVWNAANGTQSLEELAVCLSQPIDVIQQTAYRLQAVGLVKAIATDRDRSKISLAANPLITRRPEAIAVTQLALR